MLNIRNISAILVSFAAVGALLVSIYNATQISQVHIIMNSRLTELLILTKAASKAEGIKQEKERQADVEAKEGK